MLCTCTDDSTGASPQPAAPVPLRAEHHHHLPSRRLSEHLKALNGKYNRDDVPK